MPAAPSTESRDEGASATRRGLTTRRTLLVTGIAAVGVYATGDLVAGLAYDGYAFTDQAISELSAVGSPVRPLMVAFLTVHGLLLVAFGVGVRQASEQSRSLRLTGALLVAAAVIGLVLHPLFPMSSRGMDGGVNDTMHIVLTSVFVLLVLPAVLCSAVARRGWFRLYSAASLALMTVSGWLAATSAPGDISQDLPTPWLGTFERVNAYTYLIWLAVLAVTVSRSATSEGHGG